MGKGKKKSKKSKKQELWLEKLFFVFTISAKKDDVHGVRKDYKQN